MFMAHSATAKLETILLVEDHLVLLKLVHQILESAGYTVMAASSAKQATVLEEAHTGTIDLLLSDVRMRGMSGADLAISLKERRPEMRVALMSGYPGGALLAKNHRWHYIQKPFAPSSLLNTIESILREIHQPGAETA
jgi:two-component system, cell cycle sensor histidine kinase and response regulator CckA